MYFVSACCPPWLRPAAGFGVGAAAVLGTLCFVRRWPLKPVIFACLVPTVGASCYMQWGKPSLAPLLGMAWDCGAVTTGPVSASRQLLPYDCPEG
jgi:hypothetical protein